MAVNKVSIVAFGLFLAGCAGQKPGSVETRIEQLKHKDASVRRMAAMALGELGPQATPAVAALIEVLHDPDTDVRCQAALALGQIGPEAHAAVPALIEVLNDPNEQVRESARDALRQIDPQADCLSERRTARMAKEYPGTRVHFKQLIAEELGSMRMNHIFGLMRQQEDFC